MRMFTRSPFFAPKRKQSVSPAFSRMPFTAKGIAEPAGTEVAASGESLGSASSDIGTGKHAQRIGRRRAGVGVESENPLLRRQRDFHLVRNSCGQTGEPDGKFFARISAGGINGGWTAERPRMQTIGHAPVVFRRQRGAPSLYKYVPSAGAARATDTDR